MTDDKTKVRDLATELGVPTKNLLQALRELDIPAKSTSTGIAAEDVERVKNHLKETASSGQGENRREVQPGVIVRRRRQTAEEPAATGDVAPAPTPSAEAPASPSAAEPETRPAAPEQSSVQAAEPAQAAPEQPEAVPAAPEKEAKPEEPRQRQPRENKPRKRSGLRETAPAAKVISRPQDIAAAKAAEEAAAKAAAEAAAAAAKAAEEAAAKAEAEAAAKKKAENDDKPRKQPAASARPEGSSAPSLLPPVSENRAAASEGEEGEELSLIHI